MTNFEFDPYERLMELLRFMRVADRHLNNLLNNHKTMVHMINQLTNHIDILEERIDLLEEKIYENSGKK